MRMAYTLCRVVVLGMNDVDQAEPGSCRLRKSEMILNKRDILCRLRHEYVEFERCFGGQRTVWRRVYLGYW